MKSFATVLFMLSVICPSVYGQGAYLERGQSCFGIGAIFSTNEDVTGISRSVGYSINGIFEFGI